MMLPGLLDEKVMGVTVVTHIKGLLDDIRHNPENPDPYLLFADVLEEHGDRLATPQHRAAANQWAELIRLQNPVRRVDCETSGEQKEYLLARQAKQAAEIKAGEDAEVGEQEGANVQAEASPPLPRKHHSLRITPQEQLQQDRAEYIARARRIDELAEALYPLFNDPQNRDENGMLHDIALAEPVHGMFAARRRLWPGRMDFESGRKALEGVYTRNYSRGPFSVFMLPKMKCTCSICKISSHPASPSPISICHSTI